MQKVRPQPTGVGPQTPWIRVVQGLLHSLSPHLEHTGRYELPSCPSGGNWYYFSIPSRYSSLSLSGVSALLPSLRVGGVRVSPGEWGIRAPRTHTRGACTIPNPRRCESGAPSLVATRAPPLPSEIFQFGRVCVWPLGLRHGSIQFPSRDGGGAGPTCSPYPAGQPSLPYPSCPRPP